MNGKNIFATRNEYGILAVGAFGTLKKDQPFNEDLLNFYSCVYGRETEIPYMPIPTRHLTYESYLDNGYKILFTGCEVDHLSNIPGGMYGFEVNSDELRVYSNSNSKYPVIEADITWEWKHSFSAFNNVFAAGDFIADNLQLNEKFENIPEGPLLFCFSENTYGDYGSQEYEEDEILLVDPDPAWPQQYKKLEQWIQDELPGHLVLRIEHYGSTAIPGIPAKPVIDILVEVPSFGVLRREIVPRLCAEECSYTVFMNKATFCKRESYGGRRIAHIHMAPKDNPMWAGLKFRDYLRQNSELASDYGQLKRELASKYRNDRNHYTMGKSDFIKRVFDRMHGRNELSGDTTE